MSKTAIWDTLGKTDPAHTKQFSRSGGFKGTAIKPQWMIKRLTEYFGPVGQGWGMGQPCFETVRSDEGEVLVYCTVECWHTSRENVFWGVGGDKVVSRNRNGVFHDDEAFKKAFTDAVGNAFKFLGVAADVHMGQFDDSKYVQEMEREFSAKRQPAHNALQTAVKKFVQELEGCGDGDQLSAFLATAEVTKLLREVKEKLPHWWDGEDWPDGKERPAEFETLADRISRKQKTCAEVTANYLNA